MGSRNLVLLKLIREMLERCAPGHKMAEKTHHYRIEYAGKTYPTLPKGSHSDRGSRSGQAEIQIGHLRKLIRHLESTSNAPRR